MIKRAIDIVTASAGLVVFGIPMALIGTAVWMKMGRPVFYAQPRQGKNGDYFTMYKFRTMTNDVDRHGKLLPDAQRVTPLGWFLRRTSLDELPQLANILKGDMTLIGPRPAYFKVPEQYHERFSVKPGLTGLAQINGRKSCPLEERMAYDLDYIRNRSLTLDLKIAFKTVACVVHGKGTGSLPAAWMRAAQNDNADYAMTGESMKANFRVSAPGKKYE